MLWCAFWVFFYYFVDCTKMSYDFRFFYPDGNMVPTTYFDNCGHHRFMKYLEYARELFRKSEFSRCHSQKTIKWQKKNGNSIFQLIPFSRSLGEKKIFYLMQFPNGTDSFMRWKMICKLFSSRVRFWLVICRKITNKSIIFNNFFN